VRDLRPGTSAAVESSHHELEVHFREDQQGNCSTADRLYGQIRIDPTCFELVNTASHVDCTSRGPDAANHGKDLITWQKFRRPFVERERFS
jgi:hypothetical protein